MIKEIKNKLRYYRNYTEVNNTRDGMGLKINSIQGNTQQDSTTGKQLASLNTSGVNVNVGYIKAGKSYTFCFVQTITEGVQHGFNLKYNIDGVMSGIADVNFINLYQNAIATFTSEYDAILYFNPWGSNNQREFMLVEGTYSEFIPFEPYTGGIPSPNPLYPQSINSAVVREVKVHGKNYVEPVLKTTESNGISCTNNGDGSFTFNGTANRNTTFRLDQSVASGVDNLKSYNGTYTISLRDSEGNENPSGLTLVIMDYPSYTRYLSSANKTATINATNCFIYINIPNGTILNNLTVYPQLEKGSAMTEWQPYQENTITLSSPIELNKIGRVADEVAEGKLTRNIKALGTKTISWAYQSNDYNSWFLSTEVIADIKPQGVSSVTPNILSTKYRACSFNTMLYSNIDNAITVNQHGQLLISDHRYSNKETFESELDALIYAELAEPVVTDLPTEDVIALDSLKTFDGITYISTDSDIQPVMEMEYGVMQYREWQSGDYFNAEDYNRISANISYLKTYLDGLFANMENISTKEEKTYLSLIYAREINAIENELDSINRESYGLEIGTKQIYRANGKTPIYSEYDRIESALARIMEKALLHKNNLPRLAFRLGGQKGLRV